MIHQFIFAAPKPELSDAEFQDYWVHVHAVKYASRISQIKRYLIDTRIPFEGDLGKSLLPHQGIAEIWLENDTEQLASLRSEEFLQGARLDEPNWAAFWLTIGIDTEAHEIVTGPPLSATEPGGVKLTVLMKRRPGLDLATYRRLTLDLYAPIVAGLPGLRRYLHCHTRDGFYTFGEAGFDSVEQLWFDDVDALRAALASSHYGDRVRPAQEAVADPAHLFSMTAKEHWIIGPQPR
ncbi:EthD domain-containing protein [Actinoplanes sp. KI2]|uniref:EthD domain-containing protein n=1 Tax=Actinoplanes sp. KI2 TaxID=2983315 RepID=UPI0021D5B5DB|nr:EthD domain-containing protein [Actinoplanes sp. KI2]MCU7729559.1 EthD domain-containing protein [Actinoplanes sp. KI2]